MIESGNLTGLPLRDTSLLGPLRRGRPARARAARGVAVVPAEVPPADAALREGTLAELHAIFVRLGAVG